MKTSRLSLGDSGMACHLAAVDTWAVLERQGRTGALVETWVAAELRKLIAVAAQESGCGTGARMPGGRWTS